MFMIVCCILAMMTDSVNNFFLSSANNSIIANIFRHTGQISRLARVCKRFHDIAKQEAEKLSQELEGVYRKAPLCRALKGDRPLLIKIDGLFCQALKKGAGPYDPLRLQELMDPYLQADSLDEIWKVLINMASPELKLSMDGIVLDPDLLSRANQIREFFKDRQEELKSVQALDLKYKQLKVLPPEIQYFTELHSLDLSGNQLKKLPAELCCLDHLKELISDNNQLSCLPEEIGKMSVLHVLQLSYNQLQSLPSTIGGLSRLQVLEVSGNKLSKLPAEMCQLKHLEKLLANDNKLTCLPEGFGNMASLQVLNLANNGLQSIPDSLGDLSKLMILNLSGNKLSALPSTMGNLAWLLYFHLENNRIKELPESIGKLKNLMAIYLYRNKLSSLPDSFTQLTDLKYVCLARNHLSSLPENIGALTALESLVLDHNALAAIPKSIGALSALERLSLCDNQMSTLPDEVGGLANLTYFSYDNNPLPPKDEQISGERFKEVYNKLGPDKWKECIDGCYHHLGAEVFDKGLNGKKAEPGFLPSMLKVFAYLQERGIQKITADFYLQVHRIAAGHFKGARNNTIVGQKKVGAFRGHQNQIKADFSSPDYEMSLSGKNEFMALNSKLSLILGASFRLGDLAVISSNPPTMRIQYHPMNQEQVRIIFNFFLCEFYYDIGHAKDEDAKLEAIAKLIQHLEWLHPPVDGCGRTDTALLNYLLTCYGNNPALLKFPYASSCLGLNEWTAVLKEGVKAWREVTHS